MKSLGWIWTPTIQIGSGCTVHLRADELPSGQEQDLWVERSIDPCSTICRQASTRAASTVVSFIRLRWADLQKARERGVRNIVMRDGRYYADLVPEGVALVECEAETIPPV